MRYLWRITENNKVTQGWLNAEDTAAVSKVLNRNHPDAQVIYIEPDPEEDDESWIPCDDIL